MGEVAAMEVVAMANLVEKVAAIHHMVAEDGGDWDCRSCSRYSIIRWRWIRMVTGIHYLAPPDSNAFVRGTSRECLGRERRSEWSLIILFRNSLCSKTGIHPQIKPA